MTDLKHIVATLAVLGSGSLTVSACSSKTAPSAEPVNPDDVSSADGGGEEGGEGGGADGGAGDEAGEAACSPGEGEGEASCSAEGEGEGEGEGGEASCGGANTP